MQSKVGVFRRVLFLFLSVAAFSLLFAVAVSAKPVNLIPVYDEGVLQSYYGEVTNGAVYLPFEAFAHANGTPALEESGEGALPSLSASGAELTVTVYPGEAFLCANGRYFYSPELPAYDKDGVLFAPARLLGQAYGLQPVFDEEERTLALVREYHPVAQGESFYDAESLYWLSHIIYAEAGLGEPFEGKIAVGNVVLNRVRDVSTPNTIKEVIFDNRFGIQFSPAYTPVIYEEPNELSVIAAKVCLEGYSIDPDILFFYSPRYAVAEWIESTRPYKFTIGNHRFFA